MKAFHYLAGLPRTGASLLSTLLNQNPVIYTSPLSPVNDVLNGIHNNYINSQNALLQRDITGILNVGRNLLPVYYAHIDKPIIIDRAKSWGMPSNLELIKIYINATPKIIYTVRDIPDILVSYLEVLGDNLKKDMELENWDYDNSKTLDDNKCDFLMKEGGSIRANLETITAVKDPANKDIYHLVEYENLMSQPQQTLNRVYEFLGLEYYTHDFQNITGAYVYNEEAGNLPNKLHEVRPKLEKKPHTITLSDYVLAKYSGLETWR